MELRIRNLDDDLHRRLLHISVSKGQSLNNVCKEALEEYVTKHGGAVKKNLDVLFQTEGGNNREDSET